MFVAQFALYFNGYPITDTETQYGVYCAPLSRIKSSGDCSIQLRNTYSTELDAYPSSYFQLRLSQISLIDNHCLWAMVTMDVNGIPLGMMRPWHCCLDNIRDMRQNAVPGGITYFPRGIEWKQRDSDKPETMSALLTSRILSVDYETSPKFDLA